ncbi:Thiol:disulfide interchange protein TxlA [Planktothrix tepida]|uniref:Thiol:disulfide interchange protein TxlA n=1 Tax=Planktothrix tepida PCC 9214 TaxID=671072 RepID=A0A1J1LPC7_9CYAN|nr:thioredoxin family protein [Planktothrix tepida]CAD5973223.1 Thiol:disulfide interchange protein TxlA [Planktothrix tepida]CUR34424.1 Thiol:disulfide interchange protein TxlA [Planktothrix tepida PCC 9214]
MNENPLHSTISTQPSDLAKRIRNFLIAMAAIILAVAVFLGVRMDATSTSLPQLAEESVPMDVALRNGKPTLIEFYANWCTSCQAMAPELHEIKQQYAEQLNFVMLNVDNSKWLPELLKYRVDGIPHFVYLNQNADTIAQTIGEIPRNILEANLDALIAENPLPYTQSIGQVSAFNSPLTPDKPSTVDPRSHGAQVQ